MKHTIFIIILAILIIVIIISAQIMDKQAIHLELKKENLQYETYLNKIVLGTDVATLIDKVVDQNEKNKVQKDENNYYIENETNSIKIYLKMITIEKTYAMEEIYNNEISKFVQNFNLINFKCTSIEYHNQTGKIKKLIFEEIKEN